MKFEVRAMGDYGYRKVICIDSLDELKEIAVRYEKTDFPRYDDEYKWPLLIVDFNRPERNSFLSYWGSKEIDVDATGLITIYDDHIE